MAWTAKYVSVAGSGANTGADTSNEWTLAQALSGYAAGQRIKVKKGTYTAAARNWNVAGSASSGVWWEGYDTTPGNASTDADLTGDNTLTKPVIQCGTNTQTFSGAHHLFTGFDFQGNPAGTLLSVTGAHVHFGRCRAENTDSGSSSYALRATANGFYMGRSWLKANVACNYVAIVEERGVLDHVTFRGGKSGLMLDTTAGGSGGVLFCIFDDQADNYGLDIVNGTGGVYFVVNNTFYAPGSHCIRVSGTQPALGVIRGNLLANGGGYGISTVSGTLRVARLANDFYSNTSGKESGFGDWPSLGEQVESGSPFVNAAGHDFTPATGAAAIGTGAGGAFENM